MTSNAYFNEPPAMRTLPELGRRFQALRKAAGKTQTEVAQAVGMRQEALSRFEAGSGSDFSLGKLLLLLQVLELQFDFKPDTSRPSLDDLLVEVRQGKNQGADAR